MSFVELPVEVNPEGLIDTVYEDMATRFPGWVPSEAQPEPWLIRAIAYRLIIPLAQLAADVGEEIFHRFGEQIANVPPIEAAPATVTSTWTMIDNAGYTIPADTQVNIAAAGDVAVGFRVVNEVLVPAGSTATAAGEVLLEALTDGEIGNDLPGPATLVDSLAGVDSLVLVGDTSGGTDAEDPAVYLSRLAETMQTFGPHLILPRDVEVAARSYAGVSRAVALDLFDPDTDDPDDPDSWLSEKHLSVAVHDAAGDPLSAPTKATILAGLQARREANFVFHVIDPDYTDISVRWTVVPYAGWSQADADAAVASALETALSPALWGTGPEQDLAKWTGERIVRFQDIVTLVNNQQPVSHYTALQTRKGAGSWGSADLTLDGAAPLPNPGTIAPI